MQPIIADGGELTVLRSLGAFAYGSWDVEWPESTPDDAKLVLPDNRRIGFVTKLADEPGVMGRRFIRRDVSITAAEATDDGIEPGISDVETVLDEAATTTNGDAFVQRELTRSNLGALTPYVDFTIGDIVPVVIWGRAIKAPVTSIQAVTERGAIIDWRVNVGGTLIGDEKAREVTARELERDLKAERRERRGSVAAVSSVATSAKSVAEKANTKADTAKTTADAALAEVKDKRGKLQQYVEQAKASVQAGREHNAKAEKSLAESRTVLEGAVGKLAEVEKLLNESDLTLEENRKLKAAIETYKQNIERLLIEARTLDAGARQATAAAGAHGAQALAILSETEDLHLQVANLLDEAAQQVAQGKAHLEESRRLAQAGEKARVDAVAAAEKAVEYADQAETILDSVKADREVVAALLADVKSEKVKADHALEDAGGLLTQAKKAATDADTKAKAAEDARKKASADASSASSSAANAKAKAEAAAVAEQETNRLYRAVTDKHTEVLAYHSEMIGIQTAINEKQEEVLAAHSEAISLTAKGVRALAGSQAAMAGSLAYFEQCLEASNLAIEKVAEANRLNEQAIRRLDEISQKHEEAIREQIAMSKKLEEAQKVLEDTDTKIIETQEQLAASQDLVKTQTENNTKALSITNMAVRAQGGAIGGMATSISILQDTQEETIKATAEALGAAQANASAIAIQKDLTQKANETALNAERVATGVEATVLATKYASDVNRVAIANGDLWDRYQDKIARYVQDVHMMRFTRHWSLARDSTPMYSGDIFEFIGKPRKDHPSTLNIPIVGAWNGVITIQIFHENGLSDANPVFIRSGKIVAGPKYFGSVTETFLDGGPTMKIKSALVLVYPDTMPDGSSPRMPAQPKLRGIPDIPAELQPK